MPAGGLNSPWRFLDRLDHQSLNYLRIGSADRIRGDAWRGINLSARECKEDWFRAKKGGIEFRLDPAGSVCDISIGPIIRCAY